jgi:adenine C2-methylase RlmN of 23S rRNA A2503 and tRNA A37
MNANFTGEKRLIYDLDRQQLQEALTSWGEPSYRVDQIWAGLYQHLWQSPQEFTNLPLSLRQLLEESFRFS